ncbi:ribosome maturation factor RimM [Oleiagrimonas sp. C23AA]|uniref:ribosome maturation factor RimM n=1 Tax=Oleiagrimonas sp. C23AA TaxID=2719047 RepID=UPI00141F27B4|nr:ribosome maturation factor RimM [Oleiagrimonas sp. C23AA]NII10206.1 ribosome maturation factor RimM [Oleiagrimonas sp. C23AA]
MSDPVRRVRMGRIVGVYGVRGEVKLESWTEPRERIFDYQPWLLSAAPGKASSQVRGIKGRAQGKGLVAQLPGVENREQAAALMGSDILIERDQLPAPEDGAFYWFDLEGLEVVNREGHVLGKVDHLFATGANDVIVVRDGDREILVPFVRDVYVLSIDLQQGRMEVDWDPDF